MEASCLVVLLRSCVQFFALPVYLLWFLGIWELLCKKAFPYVMSCATAIYNSKMSGKKRKLFSNLDDFASSAGALKLLEIGTGSGSNFQFYPRGCRITCTEPNPNFNKFLEKTLSDNPHVKVERCLTASAEDLHQTSDASMDVVVGTLVMCSVQSIEGCMREILRVLRRGGAYYFIDHVAGAPYSLSLFWQQVFDPIWNMLFDGCHLTREPWKYLEKAGFSEVKLRHIKMPVKWVPVRPHIIGYAVK